MSDREFIARIDRSPHGWYSDIVLELHLLRGYIDSIEHQITDSISRYHSEKQTEVIYDPDDMPGTIITSHHGVDDTLYHLDTIFENFFPDLQRRSALITLFSFLEFQLDDLCKRYAEEKNFVISFTDLKGSGIDRSTLYLEKVVGLPLDKESAIWMEIKNIQSARNVIVHNNGKLKKGDKIIKYAHDQDLLSGEDELRINAAYLPYVIETFNYYSREIDALIIP